MAKKKKGEVIQLETKPMLKCTSQTYIDVDWHDLEDFICQVYGRREWNFVADQECGNDSEHSFTVTGTLSKYEKKEVSEWQESERHGTYMTGNLLDDCCAKGLIKPGTYLVSVCW